MWQVQLRYKQAIFKIILIFLSMELQFKQSQASFSKGPEICQACKVIFNSSVSKNREEYIPKNFLYEENLCLY